MKTEYLRENQIEEAGAIIRAGGLVAFRTETVYGLGCDATNESAISRIFVAKGRPQSNPLIVHFASLRDIFAYLPHLDACTRKVLKSVKSAFTVVVPRAGLFPNNVCGGLDSVAVRVPSCKTARRFIKECGVPIAAPSANSSTRPSPTSWRAVKEDLDGKIDAVLMGAQCKIGVESTVIKIVKDGENSYNKNSYSKNSFNEKSYNENSHNKNLYSKNSHNNLNGENLRSDSHNQTSHSENLSNKNPHNENLHNESSCNKTSHNKNSYNENSHNETSHIVVLRLGGCDTAKLARRTGMEVRDAKGSILNESPGTRFKHYAPSCECKAVEYSPNMVRQICSEISSQLNAKKRVAVLCLSKNARKYSDFVVREREAMKGVKASMPSTDLHIVKLGNSPRKVAHRLFDALRETEKKVDIIICEQFPSTPKFATVNERVMRASSNV